MDWKPLDSRRVFKQHSQGFLVVKSVDGSEPVPLFCSVCQFPNSSAEDSISHRQYGCCSMCRLKWADVHQEKWMNGWRPDQDALKSEIARRIARPLTNIFKIRK